MKKLSLLFVFLVLSFSFSSLTFSQLLTENFDYTAGTALTANGWTQNGTSSTNPISVGTSNGLSYAGYPSSGIGNAAIMNNTGQDDYKTFTTVLATNVYVSFLVNISVVGTGDYFLALYPSANQSNSVLRAYVKSVGTGWSLGMSKTTDAPHYGTNTFALNTTYLVVCELTYVAGALNDQYTGYVFSSGVPATEGAATQEIATYTSPSTLADAVDIASVGLRQGGGAIAPTLVIDGIRVGTTWNDAPLPVELSSFTANVNGRDVSMNWTTKTEKNSDKFVIEKQTIGAAWASIGSVKAAVLSNSPKQYSFSDKNLNTGKYQYRLKMIDNDGTFNYSNVTEAVVSQPMNFELSQNYPNPFNPSTKINYSLPSDSRVTLEVYNALGVRIGQLVNQDQSAGYYSVDFNSSSLSKSISSGVYLYKISTVDKATGNSLSAIKKMMMLK
jgi:hypothetical protein